jgi:hypothetical protein
MGRLDDARLIVERLRSIIHDPAPADSGPRNRDHRELFLSGLRMAMGKPT